MKTFRIYFILFLSLIFLSCEKLPVKITAQKGVLDLRAYPLSKEVVALDGEWNFAWQQYYETGKSIHLTEYYVMPKLWPGRRLKNADENLPRKLPIEGYGVWHLKILLPPDIHHLAFKVQDMASSYELFVNGQKVGTNGKFSTEKEKAIPQYLPNIYFFSTDQTELDIYLNISNYHAYTSGQWDSIWLGTERAIFNQREFKVASEVFFIGFFLLLGVYHLILFLLHKKEKFYFIFALFTLIASLRISVTGERYLIYLFPEISWNVYVKAEYISFYLALPFFVSFLRSVFPHEVPKKFVTALQVIAAFFIITLLMFHVRQLPWSIPSYQILSGVAGIAIFVFLSKAYQNKRYGVKAFLFGWGIFFITLVNDMLVNSNIIHMPLLVSFGVFFFILAQAYALALRSSLAVKEIEFLTQHLKKSNQAFLRFVPAEFLSFLGKDNMVDIHLGDQVKKKMSILFSDIRSFTEISENLKLKENFDFVNHYFNLMGPIVRAHNGFIDKYLGDGIMALFPGHPRNAVNAAIEMQNRILDFNNTVNIRTKFPVSIGVGIHTGQLMLGTIGEAERMQGSVISDAVNLSSRLENLTQKYGADIIVSYETFQAVKKSLSNSSRYLGFTKVKGKKKEIEIYEIFCRFESNEIGLKLQTKVAFEEAVRFFFQKRYVQAEKYFAETLQVNPTDKAALWFISEIKNQTLQINLKKTK